MRHKFLCRYLKSESPIWSITCYLMNIDHESFFATETGALTARLSSPAGDIEESKG